MNANSQNEIRSMSDLELEMSIMQCNSDLTEAYDLGDDNEINEIREYRAACMAEMKTRKESR